jgi:hypothetical protein
VKLLNDLIELSYLSDFNAESDSEDSLTDSLSSGHGSVGYDPVFESNLEKVFNKQPFSDATGTVSYSNLITTAVVLSTAISQSHDRDVIFLM